MTADQGSTPHAPDEVRHQAKGTTAVVTLQGLVVALAIVYFAPAAAVPLWFGGFFWYAARVRTRRLDVTDAEVRVVRPRSMVRSERVLATHPRATRLIAPDQRRRWRVTTWGRRVPGPFHPTGMIRSDVTTPSILVPISSGAALRSADAEVGLLDPVAGTDPAVRRTLDRQLARTMPAVVAATAPRPVRHVILGIVGPSVRTTTLLLTWPAIALGIVAAFVFGSGQGARQIVLGVLVFGVARLVLPYPFSLLVHVHVYVVDDDEVVAFRATTRWARTVREVGRVPRAPIGPLVEHPTLVPFDPPALVLHTFAGVAAEADAELAARHVADPGYSVRWTRPDGTPG